MSFVEFKDVTKTYTMGSIKVHAVHDMNFSIEEGELCVIVGPSGAGKTTVLNMLGGMDTCTSGSIYLDDKEISKLSEKERTLYRRYDIGFVFQFYNLVPNLTAKENVELASQICHDPMKPEDALSAVGLQERINNFPAQLSGGEQQRVSIARALAKNPRLLLCDEPTGALDYQTGKQILKLLQDTCKEQHKTVAIVTHNFAFTQIANRVVHVKEGQAQSIEINEHPASALTVEW
ncbi:MAG: ABC transporter ATP-binding protein [Atopobiaceae bacterium]|nr:ABC transporter ATP-binding protein [Atopobiaceae bacterium]